MKKIFLFLLLLISITAISQKTKYLPISTTPYWWKQPVAANGLGLPSGATPVLIPNQTNEDGQVYVDTIGGGRGVYHLKDNVWIRLADTTDLAGLGGGNSFQVESIAALRASTAYAADKVGEVLGYYAKGDPGGGTYFFNAASTATDNDGHIIKPTAIASIDPGRWIRVDEGIIRASAFGVTNDLTDQRAKIFALASISGVKEIIFDMGGGIAVNNTLTFPAGMLLHFKNGTKFISAGGANDTITGGRVICDVRKQCFDTTLIVLNIENEDRSVIWFGGATDATTASNGTDNLTPAKKAVAASTAGKIYFPGSPLSLNSWYRFRSTWEITTRIEIYGDGLSSVSSLLFPGTGAGVKLSSTSGASYIHDIRIRGNAGAIGTGFNSSTAHGLIMASNACIAERVMVINFDGDGIFVDGTGNANAFKVMSCKVEGNGRDGFQAFGTDGNAGEVWGLITKNNGRWGINDNSFLGNNYYGGQVADNVWAYTGQKSLIKYRTAVSHGGNRFRIKSTTSGHTNKEPGVAADWATYWELIGAGGIDATFQAWSAVRAYAGAAYYFARADHSGFEPTITSGWEVKWELNGLSTSNANEWFADSTFLAGGGVQVNNNNSRAQFYGVYKETSQPTILNTSASAMIFGGWLAGGANNAFSASNLGIIVSSPFNIRAMKHGETGLKINYDSAFVEDFIFIEDEKSAGYIKIEASSASGFLPGIRFRPQRSSTANNAFFIADVADNVGSVAAFRFSARDGSSDLVINDLFNVDNNQTNKFKIKFNGQVRNAFLVGTGNRLLYSNSSGDIIASSVNPATVGIPGGSTTQIQYNNAGAFGGIPGFTSDGTNVTAGSGIIRATRPRFTTSIDDANGNESLILTPIASAINEFTLANGAAGSNPKFTASGGDTNIGFDLLTKGTGGFNFLANSTQAAETRWYEITGSGTNYVGYKSPALAGNTVYTHPAAFPAANNYVKISSTAGVEGWADVHNISKPRNGGTTSTSTPTPDWDAQDLYVLSALVTNPTFAAPTGTPVLGQRIEILIIPDGTPRTIAWNSIYVGGTDLPLPLITEASKTMWMTFRWNSLATGGGKLQLVGHVGGISN